MQEGLERLKLLKTLLICHWRFVYWQQRWQRILKIVGRRNHHMGWSHHLSWRFAKKLLHLMHRHRSHYFFFKFSINFVNNENYLSNYPNPELNDWVPAAALAALPPNCGPPNPPPNPELYKWNKHMLMYYKNIDKFSRKS